MNDYTLRSDFPLTREQNEILDFMIQRNKCICAAQTGFGKTYLGCTGICRLLLMYPNTHAILLVPQKALKAFKKELSQKLRVSFNILSSSETKIQPGARISIITHTSLKKHLGYINKLKKTYNLILLVDEAHIFSSKDNKIYEYLASIRHYFSVCWFMTATPLKNNIEGLYWLLYILDPSILGELSDFKNNYLIIRTFKSYRMVGKSKNKRKMSFWNEEIVGYKNLDKLQSILSQYIIIKQKQYNLIYNYHQTQLTDYEVNCYLEAGKGLLRESAKDNFAVRLHDLQQIVDNINEKYKVDGELSSKEKLFIQLIKSKMDGNHPTLVYCEYNELVARLERLLNISKNLLGINQILKITGDITQKQREKVEDIIDNRTVVLITSAGTESINLQKADSIIFYDLPYSILVFTQCVGRVTRMDSKFSKQYIHILEAVGTVDSYKRCLVQINGGLITSMFGKMETLPLEVGKIDKDITRQLKNNLLWCFSKNRLLTEDELKNLLTTNRF